MSSHLNLTHLLLLIGGIVILWSDYFLSTLQSLLKDFKHFLEDKHFLECLRSKSQSSRKK